MKAKLSETSTTHTVEWQVPVSDILDAFIDPQERELEGCTWWITSGSDEGTASIVRQQTVSVSHGVETVAVRKGREIVSRDEVRKMLDEALATERGESTTYNPGT